MSHIREVCDITCAEGYGGDDGRGESNRDDVLKNFTDSGIDVHVMVASELRCALVVTGIAVRQSSGTSVVSDVRAGLPEAVYLLRGPFSKANLAAAGIEMSPAVLRDHGVLGETVPPMPPVVTT